MLAEVCLLECAGNFEFCFVSWAADLVKGGTELGFIFVFKSTTTSLTNKSSEEVINYTFHYEWTLFQKQNFDYFFDIHITDTNNNLFMFEGYNIIFLHRSNWSILWTYKDIYMYGIFIYVTSFIWSTFTLTQLRRWKSKLYENLGKRGKLDFPLQKKIHLLIF